MPSLLFSCLNLVIFCYVFFFSNCYDTKKNLFSRKICFFLSIMSAILCLIISSIRFVRLSGYLIELWQNLVFLQIVYRLFFFLCLVKKERKIKVENIRAFWKINFILHNERNLKPFLCGLFQRTRDFFAFLP